MNAGAKFIVTGVALTIVAWMAIEGFSVRAEDAVEKKQPAAEKPLTVEAARQRAKLMHDIYETTLDVIHHRYFRGDRATIPSVALEDVFTRMARQSKIKSSWIRVNAKTMNIDHNPKDEFEKQAVQAIRAGKGDYELVENGYYRRAQGIPLENACLVCHGTFGVTPKSQRFVGLVIEVPVKTANMKK